MNRSYPDPHPAIASLFAAEREVVSESEELRQRVMQRARATLPRMVHQSFVTPLAPRGFRVGIAAAAVVLLSGMCAAAFFAGYHIRSRNVAPAEMGTPLAEASVVPAGSVVVALVPVDNQTGVPLASTDTALRDAGTAETRSAVSSRAANEIGAYAMELQVLQPARQAVAERDFARALQTIGEHQRRFPVGRLAEEREALRVKALLGVGRIAEARRAGAAFRARFPKSALLGRIDQMLGAAK